MRKKVGPPSALAEKFDSDTPVNLKDFGKTELWCPGSVLRINYEHKGPITYGYPTHSHVFFRSSEVLEVTGDEAIVHAWWPEEDILAAGQLLTGEALTNGKTLSGRPALVEVPMGQGKYFLIGFGAEHRGQPLETSKLIFNAIFDAAAR